MLELPVFPLHSVLFPDMPIQLHIFEERYRQMIHFCILEKQPFGIVLIRTGQEAFQEDVEIYTTGCTARIVHTNTLKDGRISLSARGEQRFHIVRTSRFQPFLSAQVEMLALDWQEHPATTHQLGIFRSQVQRYLKILGNIHKEAANMSRLDLPGRPEMLLHLAASILQIPDFEKQTLLEILDGALLLGKLQHLFRRETAVLASTAGNRHPATTISAIINWRDSRVER
jgi:Lon protease-like protein